MLPSDPQYVQACPNPKVWQVPFYKELLANDIDPYAAYSRSEDLIQVIEEFLEE